MTTHRLAALILVLIIAPGLSLAQADHDLAAHWRSPATGVHTVMVRDETRDQGAWGPAVSFAVAAWNDALAAAGISSVVLVYNDVSTNDCGKQDDKIVVCSETAGTGWHGFTSWDKNQNDHLLWSVVKFNDTFYSGIFPPDSPERRGLACHELGHALGLGHAADPLTSCVNAASSREAPGPHDIEALVVNAHTH